MLRAIMGPGVREVEASGSGDHDSITVWHDDGRQSSIIGSSIDGTFDVTIETDKREVRVDLTSSMPSLSARVLWAALDVLTEGQFPGCGVPRWRGPFRGLGQGVHWTPTPKRLWRSFVCLDAAQRSYAAQANMPV